MRGHGEESVAKRGFVGRLAVNMGLKDNSLKIENATRDEVTVFHTPLPLSVGGKQQWRTMVVAPGDKLPLLGGEEGSIVTVQVRRAGGFFTPYWQRTLSRQTEYKLTVRPERLGERFWTAVHKLEREWGSAPQPPAQGVLKLLQEAPPSPAPSRRQQRSVSPPGWFRGGRSTSPPTGTKGSGASSSPIAPPRRQNSGQNVNAAAPPPPVRRDSNNLFLPQTGILRSDPGGSHQASPESSGSSARNSPELDSPPRAPLRQNSGRSGWDFPESSEAQNGPAQSSTIQVVLPVRPTRSSSSPEKPRRSISPITRLFGRTSSGPERRRPPPLLPPPPQERGRSPPPRDGVLPQETQASRGRSPAPLERQDSRGSVGAGGGKSPRPKRSVSPFQCLIPSVLRRAESGKAIMGPDMPSPAPTPIPPFTPGTASFDASGKSFDISANSHVLGDVQVDDDVPSTQVRPSIALQSAQNVRARGGPPEAPVRSPSGQSLLASSPIPETAPYIPSRHHAFQPDHPSTPASGGAPIGTPSPVRDAGDAWFDNEEPPPNIPNRTAQLKLNQSDGTSPTTALLGHQYYVPLSSSVQEVKPRSPADGRPVSSTLQLTKAETASQTRNRPLSASVQEVKSQFSKPNEALHQFMLQGRSPVLQSVHDTRPNSASSSPAHQAQAHTMSSPLSAASPKAQALLSPRGVLRHTSSYDVDTDGEKSGSEARHSSRPTTPSNKGIKWAANLHQSYENSPRNSIDGSESGSDHGSRHRTGVPRRSGKRLNEEIPIAAVDSLKRGQNYTPSALDALDNLLSEHEDVLASNDPSRARSSAASSLPHLPRSQSERGPDAFSALAHYAAANSPVGTLQKTKSEGSLFSKEDACPVCGMTVWAGQPRFAASDGTNYHPECTKGFGGIVHGQYRS